LHETRLSRDVTKKRQKQLLLLLLMLSELTTESACVCVERAAARARVFSRVCCGVNFSKKRKGGKS
jgi:hypothetical protein